MQLNFIGIGVRFLEKVGGEWKIIYLSEVDTSSCENDDEEVDAEAEETETEDTE